MAVAGPCLPVEVTAARVQATAVGDAIRPDRLVNRCDGAHGRPAVIGKARRAVNSERKCDEDNCVHGDTKAHSLSR